MLSKGKDRYDMEKDHCMDARMHFIDYSHSMR